MRKALVLVLLVAGAAFAKTAIDLMAEGRFSEARAILDSTAASPRYQLLLYAMTETDAQRACSLYSAITQRYPGSDCDSVARERLDLARQMGFTGSAAKPVAAAAVKPDEMIAGRDASKTSEVVMSDVKTAQAAAKPNLKSSPPTAPETVPSKPTTPTSPVPERTKIASTDGAQPAVPTAAPVAETKATPKSEVKQPVVTPTPAPAVEPTNPSVTKPAAPVVDAPKVAPVESKSVPTTESKPEPKSAFTKPAAPPVETPKVVPAETKSVPKPQSEQPVASTTPPTKSATPPVPPKPAPKSDPTKSAEAKPERTLSNAAESPAKPVAKESTATPESAKVEAPVPPKPAPTQTKPVVPTESTAPTAPKTEKKVEPTVTPPAPTKAEAAESKPQVTGSASDTKSESKPATAPSKSVAPSSAKPGEWFIQVGAFGNHDNATRLKNKLEAAGFGVKLVSRTQGDKELLQVRVGGYASKDACLPDAAKLKSEFDVPAVIITE